MSNIYNTEPPTSGKVICRTQFGDIDIELWPKEAPLACRNFIQLALEGYYDNMFVHRIIKDFMLQTGDPTGTGTGGDSIWGRPFKDETHGRIKFNHRGQVAMANSSIPNSNRSQFFITLGACEWLNRKHTIFGKVTGNTIYNVMRLNEVEVDTNDSDKPVDLSEVKIKTIEVVWNPFDDIVPRATTQKVTSLSAEIPIPKSKAKKDKKLLSFEEEEEGEDDVDVIRESKRRDKASTSSTTTSTDSTNIAITSGSPDGMSSLHNHSQNHSEHSNSHAQKTTKLSEEATVDHLLGTPLSTVLGSGSTPTTSNSSLTKHTSAAKSTPVVHTAALMKQQLMASRRAVKLLNNPQADADVQTQSSSSDLSLVEQRRLKYKTLKKVHGNRESETLNKLGLFKQNLKQQKRKFVENLDSNPNLNQDSEAGLRSQSDATSSMELENELEKDGNWYSGKLKFTKHQDDAYRNKV